MRVVRFHEYGGPEVLRLETIPDPHPRADEVLIRVRACGVNHIDVMLRSGRLRLPGQQPLPHILGMEVAGEVIAVGDRVQRVRVGDRVLAAVVTCGACAFCQSGRENLCEERRMLGTHLPGGYAEFVTVPERGVIRLPDALEFSQAAAARTAFGTAWHLLIERGRLRAGEVVLIHSASSGVGSAGVQIARLAGARVIATTSSEKKAEALRALGAHDVIVYTQHDVVAEVRRLTEGRGADLVFDVVGGEVFLQSLQCVAKGGRVATCGAIRSDQATINIIHLFFREIEIIGATGSTQLEVEGVLRLVAEGRLRPLIDRVLPLSEASQAHRLMEEGQLFGKILLVPGE
ncbi:Alcohol dehydrogenase [bacterium HR10]|nr:Alcohol dehydrogenase [bacterium HR10]